MQQAVQIPAPVSHTCQGSKESSDQETCTHVKSFLNWPRAALSCGGQTTNCVVVKQLGCAAAAQSNEMVWHVSRDLAAHALKTIETAAEAVSSTDGSSSSDAPGPAAAEPNSRVVYEIPLAVLILILYIVLGHSLELWKNHQQADAAA
eukprot:18006-Heterococcus_DN1.PRE.3